ncbi:MAG: hypothetical protein WD009_08165 [Phycisphaeraceae bacterium]
MDGGEPLDVKWLAVDALASDQPRLVPEGLLAMLRASGPGADQGGAWLRL